MSASDLIKKGHSSRWLVALVLIPPTLLAILGPWPMFLLALVAFIGSVAWWEFAVNLMGRDRPGLFGLGLAGWLVTAAGAYFYGPQGQEAGLVFSLATGAVYLMYILEPQPDKVAVNLVSRYALGHFYISFLFSFVLLIKQEFSGGQWLLYVILVTCLADTGGFYFGRTFKGPKLFVKVSPNKTVSGLLGSCLCATVTGALSSNFLPFEFHVMELAFLGLFLGVWGAFGDLFESALKRAMGIKDTSTILMGHGGVWDRLDSLLFNLPPVYFFISWQMNP